MLTILLVILIILALGGGATVPEYRWPGGIFGLVLIVLLVLLLMGRI